MWTYHWFAEHKNWTPQQVDELTLEQAYWFPVIQQAQEHAQAKLSDND